MSYRYKAVFFRPSVVFEAKSTTPVTGLTTKPAIPCAVPLKNPTTPSFFVFSYGLVKTPVIPYLNPLNTAFPPFYKPSKICFGFFIFYFSLISSNYLSNVKTANPEAIVPVTFYTEFKAPPIEWAISEVVPSANPFPNSNGPYTNPSLGLSFKSLKPVDTFLNKLTGFPIIFKEPKTLYNCLITEPL